MRTQSEIKKNNIRKANLLREAQARNNRGQMTNQFGLYEQCGTQRDTDGEYMGAPVGTEPVDMMMGIEGGMDFDMDMMGDDMDMMGDDMDMMGDDMDMMGMMDDDDEYPMDNEMGMSMMSEKKVSNPDHTDRSEFDGRPSKVIGVDSNIKDQRLEKESYKAVSATPSRDGWGNKFNHILTESKQVSTVNSLMNRMKKVIK